MLSFSFLSVTAGGSPVTNPCMEYMAICAHPFRGSQPPLYVPDEHENRLPCTSRVVKGETSIVWFDALFALAAPDGGGEFYLEKVPSSFSPAGYDIPAGRLEPSTL